VRLFAEDMEKMVAFYRTTSAFAITEETKYKGHRCVFPPANTGATLHRLYPLALRESSAFAPTRR